MLRSLFIYLSKADWARQIVTRWPIVWRMASRFISGETLGDAIQAIKALNSKGIQATLDHLGEHTTNAEAAKKATQDIKDALDVLCESGVRANISIKLTQIGLGVDEALCADNLRQIMEHARQCGNFIRVDMEDSSATQKTLDLIDRMRGLGYTNLGVVIQSYLYRSDDDIKRLMSAKVPVRLCKGAYQEPAEIAYPRKADVDTAYDRMCDLLIQASVASPEIRLSEDGKFPPLPALATHDEKRILHAQKSAQAVGLAKNGLEFQMLHGIRRDLQERLAAQGYPVRVYVPYGTEWYPYFMRRLAERPANVWFLISNFFRR
jgi:proline dehydrogenase